MEAYLINVKDGTCGPVTIEDEDRLSQYYDLIGCDCIDIAVREVGGIPFNVIVDDCGLLVDRPVVSAVNACREPCLAGNLIVTGMREDDGDVRGLTGHELGVIMQNVIGAVNVGMNPNAAMLYPVLAIDR